MDTTQHDRTHPGSGVDRPTGITLTVLWHADARRIGARAHLAPPADGPIALSRLAPHFDDGQPIASPFVSRSPLELVARGGGAYQLWPGRGDLRYTLDDVPGRGGEVLDDDALARGVRLGLGQGALVLVERGWRPGASRGHELAGASRALDVVRQSIDASAPLSCPVLVLGASGTGKELVARALHAASARATGPFVTVNAAALAASTAPSQLFGHARGAFTGADRSTRGYFGQAAGGTLLLDEIGACPHEVQAQLLRALQTGEVQPVGGRLERVDVRVIASTDEDLETAIHAGRFRAPLMYRLASRTVEIPRLRERPADIATQLVHHLALALGEVGRAHLLEAPDPRRPWLSREVVEALLAWPWPGNSRELAAVADQMARASADAERCALPCLRGALGADAAPSPSRPPTPPARDAASVDDDAFVAALRDHDYRLRAVADHLGVSINTVRRRMESLDIRRPRDLDAAEIDRVVREAGSVDAAARQLEVSAPGLRLRITELGLDLKRHRP